MVNPAPTVSTAPPPPPLPPPGLGQPYTHPQLGYTITIPAGWAIDTTESGDALVLRPTGSDGRIDVYARPLKPGDTVMSTALGWEGNILRPGSGTNLHTKLGGREIVVDGSPAYEGLYRGDDLMTKAVYVGKPERIFVILSTFTSREFPERVAEIDQVVESFTTGAAAPPPSLKPLTDLLEGLGRILQGR
jgi:predicted Zn-dependent protease